MGKLQSIALPDLLRRGLLSWLSAACLEYLLLSPALKSLADTHGLAQMSFVRVLGVTAAVFLLLTTASFRLSTAKAERWGLLTAFSVLAALSLVSNFSAPFCTACLLVVSLLAVYAVRGWNGTAEERSIEQGHPFWLWLTAALGLAFFLFVSVWTVYRVWTFSVPAYDFGIFVQMFHSMKTTGLPMTTVERDGLLSHFHVHMSPIYYLILPFYCLVPRPETLQVLQAAVMASAVIPLWKLGRHHGLSGLQRTLLCALLVLYPAFAGGAAYDLHENCFLTPLLLWLLYGLDSRNTSLTAVAALLTLCIKEDAAVYVAVIALFVILRAALRYRKENRRELATGLVLLGVSLVWFGAVTGFLATVGDGVMTSRYRNFMFNGSDSLVTVIQAVILSPMKAIFECVDQEKLIFIGMTLCPLLFLPFLTRRQERYVLLIPYLLVNLMSDYQYQHDLFYQYAFGSTALLIYLTTVNLADLKVRRVRTVAMTAAVVMAFLCFGLTAYPKATAYPERYVTWQDTYEDYREAMAKVPKDASVTAGTHYVAPLAQREVIYSLRHTTLVNLLSTQYVVMKTNNTVDFRNFHSEGKEDGCDVLIAILKEQGYELIHGEGTTLQIYYRP